jgi:hypothetical protein
MKINKNLFGALIVLCVISCSGIAFSASVGDTSKRAVSEPNATIDLSGGSKDGNGDAEIGGVVTIPLNDKLGLQIDSVYGKSGGVDSAGVAGHYFYRDPEQFLVGATAALYSIDSNEITRYGVEGEYYLDNFTIAPSIGMQSGNGIEGSTGFYGLDLSYYPTDNLKFTLTGQGYADTQGASGEVEWQPSDKSPLTTYMTVGDSENSNSFALLGVRYNFGGECQSLKYRNRHSDPENIAKKVNDMLGQSILKDSESSDSSHPTCCSCEGPASFEGIGTKTPACCPCSN